MNAGLTVLANHNTFKSYAVPLDYFKARVIEDGHGYRMGGFKILPVPVSHDVTCHAFLIDHPGSGRVLFMTDTFMSEYNFPGLNHLIIECNYADDILEQNIMSGSVYAGLRPRLMTGHMELETLKNMLKASDLTNVINIVLCHLSSGNSDEERFIREVREVTGKQVWAAKKGLELDFGKEPY